MFKAAWLTNPGEVAFLDKPHQSPGDCDVRVRIRSCGICGTDVHFYRDYPAGSPTPLGHEVSGTVEEIGADVRNVNPGDSVVVMNHVACGTCTSCLNQKPQNCTGIITYMNDQAGIAEYLTVRNTMVIKYDGLDHNAATIAEPLTVSLDLWREAAAGPGDDVLIIGPGTIGLGLILLLRRSGVRNIVIAGRKLESGRGRARTEAAGALGADLCIDTSDPDWKNRLKNDFPAGFHKVVVTAPPRTIPDGIDLAGFGADIIYNGISFSEDSVTFSANELHFQKKHLKTSHAIPNWGFPIALDLLKSGAVDPSMLITHRFSFNETDRALRTAMSEELAVIKVVVEI